MTMYFKDHFDGVILDAITESTLEKLSKATNDDEKRHIIKNVIAHCYCDGSDITSKRFVKMMQE